MKRIVMQLMRTLVTVIVVGTMAVMIFSLRGELRMAQAELKEARAKLAEDSLRLSTAGLGQDEGVYVLCRFDLKPGADVADYVAKTRAVVPTVRAEDGCLGYALVRDADVGAWDKPMKFGERTLWCVERWASVEALKAHLNTPHMKAFGPTVRDLRAASTFHVLESVK